jgi:hypothetical protein
LEYELALRLGELIFSSGTEDKQLRALGHKLLNIEEEENQPPHPKWIPNKNPMTSSIVSNIEEEENQPPHPKWIPNKNPTTSSIVSEWQKEGEEWQGAEQQVPVSSMRDKIIAKRTRTHKWGLE